MEPQIEVKSLPGQTFEVEGSSVQTTSREEKSSEITLIEQNCFGTTSSELLNNDKKKKLNLSQDTLNHLLELQANGIDIDEIVRLGLKKRKGNLEHEKMEIGREEFRKAKGKKTSRRMSVKIKTVLEKEFGTKCAVPGCRRDKDHIHHTLPFSLIRSNDPRFLIPLCKEHHDVVHIVNEKVWEYKS